MYGLTKAPLVLALLVALVGVLAGGCDRIARYYGYDAGARPEDAAKDATGDLDAPSEMRVGDLPIDGPPGDTMPPDCIAHRLDSQRIEPQPAVLDRARSLGQVSGPAFRQDSLYKPRNLKPHVCHPSW